MKIAHECPIDIFDKVEALTDYSYALVHLFEENEAYYNKFVEAKNKGREIILDNSIFELGESFDGEKYAKWIRKLQPTWYIVPDKLEDTNGTIKKLDDWFTQFTSEELGPSKPIGVIQGKTYNDIKKCYQTIEPAVDKVAISFDYSWYREGGEGISKWQDYVDGRIYLIEKLFQNNVINVHKPHHLLGCALPQEFQHYKGEKYSWIDSIDTSNPVVAGMHYVRYTETGLNDKITTKLCDLIDAQLDTKQVKTVLYNISKFKSFCR